jgi:hypothetical protein
LLSLVGFALCLAYLSLISDGPVSFCILRLGIGQGKKQAKPEQDEVQEPHREKHGGGAMAVGLFQKVKNSRLSYTKPCISAFYEPGVRFSNPQAFQ